MNFFHKANQIANGVHILTQWLGSGGTPCDQETAQARANICIACPKNEVGFRLTEAVADAIKKNLEMKSEFGLRVDGEKSLHSCGICGCSNKLQVWCPAEYIKNTFEESEKEKYPEPCWKKHL
jgi:hypothetical protein